ncbi:(5-formylfuran-3-yl)methyl phosphate synthase [uncultured Methylobacterium sp.]|uniref:(5-formylfuran-3-yl)methyl phosphate synthase n=1 Tax=uncultured Methylobacterium sp. TaxID=157278 RepID=UPI0035CC3968
MSRLETPYPIQTAPRFLVSVRNVLEAESACLSEADLVDAKDPALGALGALDVGLVRAMVAQVAGRKATSAVAGEPKDARDLAARVAAMAATGVDYVKVALPPALRADPAALVAAAGEAPGRLIAVLFAEDGVDLPALPRLAEAGFVGAMIDTGAKNGRRLTDWITPDDLAAFTTACRAQGLISGLAGSLCLADIPALAGLGAGYLGFRGGLCLGGDRRAALDPKRVAEAARTLRAAGRRDAA